MEIYGNQINEQLDCEVNASDFPVLATYFNNIELYVDVMGLSASEQADVRRLVQEIGTQAAMITCLNCWRNHNPVNATYRVLLSILSKLHEMQIAKEVCQYWQLNYFGKWN